MYADRQLCPMVDSVEEIGSYVPANAAEKQPLIQHIHDCLANAARLPEPYAHPGRAAGPVAAVAGKAASRDGGQGRVPEARAVAEPSRPRAEPAGAGIFPAFEHVPGQSGGRHAECSPCPAGVSNPDRRP